MSFHRTSASVSLKAARTAFEQGDFATVVDLHDATCAAGSVDPVLAVLAGQSLADLGRGDESLRCFSEAMAADGHRALSFATQIYLNRRRRTSDGFQHEDGWIRMLDVVLESDLIPVVESREALWQDSLARPKIDAIPRSIVQFWDKPNVPQEVSACVESVRDANIAYDHRLFCEEEGRDLVVQVLGSQARSLFEACPHPAAKSDFFRAAYLYEHGGVYVDADERMDGRLADHLDIAVYDLVLSYTRANPTCVNNWFVACAPGHPVVTRALQHVVSNLENIVDRAPDTNVWVMTGPGAWSFAVSDVAIDPLDGRTSAPLARSCFMSEFVYRGILSSPPMQYKDTVDGNWRLLTTDATPVKSVPASDGGIPRISKTKAPDRA